MKIIQDRHDPILIANHCHLLYPPYFSVTMYLLVVNLLVFKLQRRLVQKSILSPNAWDVCAQTALFSVKPLLEKCGNPYTVYFMLRGWPELRPFKGFGRQCYGSMTSWCGSGSGSADPCRWLLFSSLTFKMPKTSFFVEVFCLLLFCLLLFEDTFTSYFKDRKSRSHKKSRNKGFSYNFCLLIEGSGSGMPKNMWIRWIRIPIRIRTVGRMVFAVLGRIFS